MYKKTAAVIVAEKVVLERIKAPKFVRGTAVDIVLASVELKSRVKFHYIIWSYSRSISSSNRSNSNSRRTGRKAAIIVVIGVVL